MYMSNFFKESRIVVSPQGEGGAIVRQIATRFYISIYI